MLCSATPPQPPTSSKNLNRTLSSAILHLTQLKELSLSHNHLVDRIPNSIVNLKKLEILDLRGNGFSGEVPPHLFSLARLRLLDVSSNKLSGNLNFLKYFPNLEKLNVADNHFVGRVPVSIRSFRNLRHFNFSGNSFLEGSTPIAKSYNEVEDFQSVVPRRFIFAEDLTGEAGFIGGARCQKVLRFHAGGVQEALPWVEAVSPVKNQVRNEAKLE
ncbi:leucine-rich repeat receptor-like serine/threonine/tyrosine-protein kinase SOBIR1 isoform X2 [Arachis ipaensis]|uniref:leucine-rich repeat receptor-like serine/threonine/tyrosine-protein kinase SOBIR1 isoform X2 n=1 Tax=Arachis ipaensis TaxID=130454 RepID=UPI000A2B66C7|nr:leucine-rich repeat receptor-like serine/threonine/tyrosine-protein kinase SOBIR1 isoform X2 [Arachis ipaensis]